MTPPSEILIDLVDERDEAAGQIPLSDVFVRPITNYRMIYAFLVNSRGKIWVPKRAKNKEAFPNALDLSLADYVHSGEDYDAAFRRAAKEKLNIDIDQVPWKFLSHLTPRENGVSAFENVYRINSDILPEFDPNEYSESHWITPQEIIKKVEIREPARDDLGKLTHKYMEEGWGD